VKRHGNTLYVTTQGSYVARERETVVVRVGKETRIRIPVHTLEGLVFFGRISCSPSLMQLCTERGVSISFLSERGRFIARVEGPVSGNVLLRREQYRRADDEQASALLVTPMVQGKVANGRNVLLRAARESQSPDETTDLRKAAERLSILLKRIDAAKGVDAIRGLEGESARTYFSVFNHLITVQKEAFRFTGRNRRPPLDRMNALLSFLYTLLGHDMRSALETVGLDPAVGYLHKDRPGRPGLSLDLMEEFRAFLADRLALSLVNRRQVTESGFTIKQTGGVVMTDETRKVVLTAWQKRKSDELMHPFLQEKATVGLLPLLQARLLARHLRGDLDAYPPFILK